MKKPGHPNTLTRCAGGVALCAALWAIACPGIAQTVYRIVAPDGKVTFSDKPPLESGRAVGAAGNSTDAARPDGPALPFALRQVVSRYPVMLYTSNACTPCDQGRSLLTRRGVPFTEKTVNTSGDVEALQRISGDSSLPFLSIGGQQIKGYSDAEWAQFLDAADYPKSSVLPVGYRNPASTPLVAAQNPTVAAKPEATPPNVPVKTPPPPPAKNTNPAGIKF